MQLPELRKDAKFESKRLILRGIVASDAENLVRWRSREDVYRNSFNPRPITHTEHDLWFARYMENKQAYRAIIAEKASGNVMGIVGGEYENGVFVISYYIGEPMYRGNGFASEAIQALIEFLNINYKVEVFHAYVNEGNSKSISVLIRLGFFQISVKEGTTLYEYSIYSNNKTAEVT